MSACNGTIEDCLQEIIFGESAVAGNEALVRP